MKRSDMKTLPIVWQRLVKAGAHLRALRLDAPARSSGRWPGSKPALRPLGIRPVLQTEALDESTFKADPSASNRIWIAGKPMEDWLGASVGVERRAASSAATFLVGHWRSTAHSFEAVPQDLVLKAAMIAAAGMIDSSRPDAGPDPCCANACSKACD